MPAALPLRGAALDRAAFAVAFFLLWAALLPFAACFLAGAAELLRFFCAWAKKPSRIYDFKIDNLPKFKVAVTGSINVTNGHLP